MRNRWIFFSLLLINTKKKRADIIYLSIPGVPSAMTPESSEDIIISSIRSILLLIFCSLMKSKY